MKKKFTTVYTLFWTILCAAFLLSNNSNPPNGHTGSPPTFNTCSDSQGGCHSGGTGTGNVVISGLPATITPNTMYPITVTVTRTNSVPQLGGFQMNVLDANNNNAGTLSGPGSGSTVQSGYFEHNPAQSFGAGNSINFTVNWTSPASGSGNITMYAAANLANGNGNNSGDDIVTTTSTGTIMGGGPIAVTISTTNVSCFAGNNGTATANASGGGGGPYTYSWSNGGSGQTITNLPAGTYTVTVTNSSGGNGTASATITQPGPLSVSIINQVNVTCVIPIGSATAQASGGTGSHTYNWSNGSTGATASLPAGTHTVTVTDGNGCTATTSVNITANITPPIAEAGPPAQIDCSNPTATLNGTGSSAGAGFSYLWTTSNGIIISGTTTLNPVVGSAGTYTLTVTNAVNGCTASDFTTVISNLTAPVSNAGPDMTLTCSLPSVQLNGSGSSSGANFTYLWTTANGNIISGANTLTPTVNAPGTYCLTVTNTTNGCTTTDCANVTQNITAPVANAGSASPLTCNVSSVTLNGSASSSGPNFTYLWTTANGNIVSGETTTMPVVNAAGVYTLTVTNTNNGCTASSSVTVTSNTTPPNADAGPGMFFNCNNSVVVLNGSASSQGANFSYAWEGPGIQSGGNTTNPAVDAPGTYTITVTNTSTGCTALDSTTVAQTPQLTATIPVQVNVNCNGNNSGSATAQGSGGAGDYNFAWSNGATGAQASNLSAGIYTVTITDEDDCTATASISITEPPILSANASATGESSVGANDGSATASPTGGVPGYSYEWNTGATTQTITGLAPGNFTVTVTDDNGCSAVQTVTVSSFSCANFSLNLTFSNPSCNGSSNGQATVSPVGGTMPYEILWSNGDTTATADNLTAGSYMVTVTDDNGCEETGNVSLTAPPVLNLSVAQQTNVSCNGASNGSATISATGGTPNYVFAWSNGGSGASQNNLAAGLYTVTLTDENDCTATIQVNVSQPPALTGNVTATGETGVGANDGTATAAMSGGVAPYQFAWSNGATTSSINNLAPGEYCVTVTDANNCTFTGCATVSQFGCIGTTTVISGEHVTCFGGNDGLASLIATGFASPLTYKWSNGGTGATIGNLAAGVYSVTVTDANGCTGMEEIEITEPEELALQLLNQNNVTCAGDNTGAISVNGTGGIPGYTFSWSNGANTPTISFLSAGIYEVTLSDSKNCTTTMSFEIEVSPDTIPPVALASGLSLSLNANGEAFVTTQMLDGGSFDNCHIDTIFLSAYQFGCDDIGENFILLTVVDGAGNSASDTAAVFIVDNVLPVITCPANIVIPDGNCETPVIYETPLATDNCDNVTAFLLAGFPSGGIFPAGTTVITWGADDNNGNTVFCTFSVTVETDFKAVTSFTAPSCFGFKDATATATPNGGIPPYGYEWNDPAHQLTQTATGLAAGVYQVTITDSEGCITVGTIEITEPEPVLITVDQVLPEMSNNMDGAVSITVTGGNGSPFTYEWTYNGAFFSNEEDLTGLSAGTYVLHATDPMFCTATDTIEVEKLTGIFDPYPEDRINLFPNPAAGQSFLRFDLLKTSEVSFQIFDLTGRPLWPEQQEQVLIKTFRLDLTDTAPGIYLLRIRVDEKVMLKKVVVGR